MDEKYQPFVNHMRTPRASSEHGSEKTLWAQVTLQPFVQWLAYEFL